MARAIRRLETSMPTSHAVIGDTRTDVPAERVDRTSSNAGLFISPAASQSAAQVSSRIGRSVTLCVPDFSSGFRQIDTWHDGDRPAQLFPNAIQYEPPPVAFYGWFGMSKGSGFLPDEGGAGTI